MGELGKGEKCENGQIFRRRASMAGKSDRKIWKNREKRTEKFEKFGKIRSDENTASL